MKNPLRDFIKKKKKKNQLNKSYLLIIYKYIKLCSRSISYLFCWSIQIYSFVVTGNLFSKNKCIQNWKPSIIKSFHFKLV